MDYTYEWRYAASLRSLFTLLFLSLFFYSNEYSCWNYQMFISIVWRVTAQYPSHSAYSRQSGGIAVTTLFTLRALLTAATAQCERKYPGRRSLQKLLFTCTILTKLTTLRLVVRLPYDGSTVLVPISTIPDEPPLHEMP